MGMVIDYSGICCSRLRSKTVIYSVHGERMSLRRRVLRKVDNELAKGNTKGALSLVKQLQGKPGGLRGFGAAKQVPQRRYALDELDLDRIDMPSLQPIVDLIMETTEKSLQFVTLGMECSEEVESMIFDSMDQFSCEEYHNMCNQHEAGHFLIAYLLGVLPKGYFVPSVEAMRKDDLLGGKVDFAGFEFLSCISTRPLPKKKAGKIGFKVNRGKVSSTNLNRYSCVALGGIAAECLVFGYSEGSLYDVEKLDELFKWLGYTESETQSRLKWAVLNTALILHRHCEARSKLAEAMLLGRSIGVCIDTIENALEGKEI